MKLSKNAVRILLFAGIALVCFNVIAFLVPFCKTGTFWTGYIFGMLAIVLQLVVMKVAFHGAESVRSKFYGFPIARIGVIYGICQILLSFAAMALSVFIPFWIPMVVFILMLAAAAAGCIAADAVRETIEKTDEKLVKDVSTMRNIQSKMNLLVSQSDCPETLKKALSGLNDDIKYSDPVSGKATEELETELGGLISELQKTVVDGETESAIALCKKAKGILAERNRVCKLSKNQK